jgi:hypothetical protein
MGVGYRQGGLTQRGIWRYRLDFGLHQIGDVHWVSLDKEWRNLRRAR